MTSTVVRSFVFAGAFCFASLLAQPKPSSAGLQEFPVIMRQSVVAGKTPVGTKVEANLTLATLTSGQVIPEGATFSGEVVESVAKSATTPSRLSIRMDSVRWKKGNAAVKLYLTAWYYPIRLEPDDPDKNSSDPLSAENRRPVGFPGQRNPEVLPPIPSHSAEKRVLMKDVDLVHDSDGVAALTSTHLTLKLDRSTTYVFATADPTTAK
jgi:hypothetical protein